MKLSKTQTKNLKYAFMLILFLYIMYTLIFKKSRKEMLTGIERVALNISWNAPTQMSSDSFAGNQDIPTTGSPNTSDLRYDVKIIHNRNDSVVKTYDGTTTDTDKISKINVTSVSVFTLSDSVDDGDVFNIEVYAYFDGNRENKSSAGNATVTFNSGDHGIEATPLSPTNVLVEFSIGLGTGNTPIDIS